ncbi:glycosyltransferase family 4 protein [Paradesertivirga mongoliensis]|uniref:Glycosyltransferase family 4 protein n=1 Tax=Paradesertivirga mongoliensis TaxID=2100740 RepID=A0ABW4ZI09_9SPHI|nr:glycosyltransferase family 4 protein [Pedobacter mongoliensis]
MKITYTAPNRSHHYPYAEALHRAGHLFKLVSGFSRFSPRAGLPSVGDKITRHDLIKNIHLACLKFKVPFPLTSFIDKLSALELDYASYKWANQSDAFIYYRTDGYKTTQRLRKEGSSTLCVMEEVNSHVEFANEILEEEYKSLGLKGRYYKESDYDLRLKTYEISDCILCPSEFVRSSFITKGFSPERLLKVNFGFPAIEIADQVKPVNETFRVLYVGQIHYRKGLRYALEAFKKLKHPKKEFIIVGPSTLVTGLENITVPDGVTFTGSLKGEDLKDQYRNASVFILPSLEEGLALVQGEALAFGLPVLITTNTGGADFIENGREGFIVAPGKTEPLAECLQQMADDKLLLQEMSAAALHTAKTLGSWDIAVEKLIAQLKVLTDGENKTEIKELLI